MKASTILYTTWEALPIPRLKLILQILPLIRWDQADQWSNTYLKNFLLKQLFKSKKLYLSTTPEQRVDLYTYELDWLRRLPTTFPMKSYTFEGITFRAPAPFLANITVEQLMEAEIALHRYIHRSAPHYLHHFFAVLYTVKGVELTDDTLDQHAKLLSKIPHADAVAIIRAFVGSYEKLRIKCPTIFPQPIQQGAEQQKTKAKPTDPAESWQKLLFELSNTAGYPGMSTAKAAQAWEALPYFEYEQDKIRREIERLKNRAGKA